MTFYFYDLETTGFNPRAARIMQFAGQRTTLDLKPIGEPDDFYIKITEDTLPDPGAILVTGITPQKTLADGITEAEFAKIFSQKINQPDTIFVGYNNIRFDDEFMRHLFYRNFYDPFDWQWQNGNSRWDLLDVTRMTRALRPDGIKWPVNSNGQPTNQLSYLTSINKLDHENAHHALNDVMATIALAQLLLSKQPKLFRYLLKMRGKQAIADLVNDGKTFVYSSGKYANDFEKTTVVVKLANHPKRQGALVYDLRYNPADFANLTPNELAKAWQNRKPEEGLVLPIKTLQYNRCPAVAPLGVLDEKSQNRLKINMLIVNKNLEALKNISSWPKNLLEALEILDKQQQARLLPDRLDVDNQLYDEFINNANKALMAQVRQSKPEELENFADTFQDNRLKALLPLYKARNFVEYLNEKENEAWHDYRLNKLTRGGETSRIANYFKTIEELNNTTGITKQQKFLLEELKLYGESLI